MNLTKEIEALNQSGLYRQRRVLESAQGAIIKINGRQVINFSSNDYLGLANNSDLKDCMIDAIKDYGLGAGSSQLITGHFEPHQKLEQKLADFLKRDAALVFPSGYHANLAIASTLINKETIIFQDKLNHASLIDAALLSKGRLVRYRHNDTEHLSSLMHKYKDKELLVMTDGVFSMDGDYAPLNEIEQICKKYGALLIVDDAHGVGVLGNTGAGLLEKLELDQEQVPLLIGTFGKAFAASGAFVAGSHEMIDYLIQKARTYIYTTALMPAIAKTLNHTVDMVRENTTPRKKLIELVNYFKDKSKNCSFANDRSDSHIQPIIIGSTDKTMSTSNALLKKNILASAIRPPTIPRGTSRLRISLTAAHKKEQIDQLFSSLLEVA